MPVACSTSRSSRTPPAATSGAGFHICKQVQAFSKCFAGHLTQLADASGGDLGCPNWAVFYLISPLIYGFPTERLAHATSCSKAVLACTSAPPLSVYHPLGSPCGSHVGESAVQARSLAGEKDVDAHD